MKNVILFLSLLLLAVGCSSKDRELKEVSRVLETDPESALNMLDGIDREALSARGRAEFDLLTASSFYRTYFFLDDPSEAALERSCLYFDENGPAVDRMRAWELKGAAQTASNRNGSGLISFMKAEAIAREIDRSRTRTGQTLLLLVAILSTLILYLWARKVQTEKLLLQEREENDRVMSIAEDLQSKIGSMQARTEKKALPLAGMDTLDRLCEQYYVYEGTSNLQPKILKEVRSIVEGLRGDPKVQKNLEQSLDEGRDGVMKRLRAAFPKWKDEDYLLYAFSASGFSSTTISTLLEKDKPYVYNRVYRLKERIKASDSPDKEFLLACLGK